MTTIHHHNFARSALDAWGLVETDLAELEDRDIPEQECLLGTWLKEGEGVLLWAPAGVGKTMFSLTVSQAIAGGGSVFGWDVTRPRRVLYVDAEMRPAVLRKRMRAVRSAISGSDAAAVMRNHRLLSQMDQPAGSRWMDLAREEDQGRLLQHALAIRAELVVIDNLSTCAKVADENSAASFQSVNDLLVRLKAAGIAVILVHHSGKSGAAARGSSALETTFEHVIGLKRPTSEAKDQRPGARFTVEWTKARDQKDDDLDGQTLHLPRTEGPAEWIVEKTSETKLEALVRLVRSKEYVNQSELAWGMPKTFWRDADTPPAQGSISKLKDAAIKAGLIKAKEWESCLDAAVALRSAAEDDGQTPGEHDDL